MKTTIDYTCGTDWGMDQEPTEEEVRSLEEFIARRLQKQFPGAAVSVDISSNHLSSLVRSSDPDIDCQEVARWIGVDVWADWIGADQAEQQEENTEEVG